MTKKLLLIVNGNQASFADILVIFPCGKWWLVQCKKFEVSYQGEYSAYYELGKMGFVCDQSAAGWAAETIVPDDLEKHSMATCLSSKNRVKRRTVFKALGKNKENPLFKTAQEVVDKRKVFWKEIRNNLNLSHDPHFLFFCAGNNPGQFRLKDLIRRHGDHVSFKFAKLTPEPIQVGARPNELYSDSEASDDGSEQSSDEDATKKDSGPNFTLNGMYPIIPATVSPGGLGRGKTVLLVSSLNPVHRSKRGRQDEEEMDNKSKERDKVEQDTNDQ